MPRRAALLAAVLLSLFGASPVLAAPPAPAAAPATLKPEDPGAIPFTVHTVTITLGIDPNGPSGAFPDVTADLYIPAGGGPWPVVELSHGNMNASADHAEWGRRLASRGILAIVTNRRQQTFLATTSPALDPHIGDSGDFDWRVDSEDQLRILRWALAQSAAGTGPLAGKVDPGRLALAGHSLGGSYAANGIALAQTEGPKLAAGFLLDDTTGPPGYDPAVAATTYTVPTVVLTSDPSAGSPGNVCPLTPPGTCATVLQSPHSLEAARSTFDALPAALPKLGVEVVNGLHGEMEDPDYDDASPSVAHQRLYQRYGMAFLECWLLHDSSAAPYLNGTASSADQADGKILVFKGSTPTSGQDCAAGFATTAAPVAVAEAPATALVVLPGLGVAGGFVVIRRRRRGARRESIVTRG